MKEIYPFELYNLYLAKENKRAEEIKTIDAFFEYCRENNISSLSMDKSVFTEEVKDAAAENNMICYVFTVNDLNDLQCDIDRSDIIIGTDFLRYIFCITDAGCIKLELWREIVTAINNGI